MVDPTGHKPYTCYEDGKYRVLFSDKFTDTIQDLISFAPGGFLSPYAVGENPITGSDLQEVANATLDTTSVAGKFSKIPLVKTLGKVAGNVSAAMNLKQMYDDTNYDYDLDRLTERFLSDVLVSDSREGSVATYAYAKVRMNQLRNTGKVGFVNTDEGEGCFWDPDEIKKIKEEIWAGNVTIKDDDDE